MRAVAYWPKQGLYFELRRHDHGEPYLEPIWSHKSRPVFWVLATPEEAEKSIVPHMVNSVLYWRHIQKEHPNILEDAWVWPHSGEFSFFVPWLPRLTDAPTVFHRVFPYSGLQSQKPWNIGSPDPNTFTTLGIEIPDIEHETFCDIIDRLKQEGSWNYENWQPPRANAGQ
jgi:hypothetical protein